MYSFTLTLHSILRWFVLLAGIVAAGKAIFGWMNNAKWTRQDNQLSLFFMIGTDLQVLLGLILYIFLSPITEKAFSDFGGAMADAELRFFAVDHIFLMIVALALAHAGRILPKRTTDETQKHKKAAIIFSLAVSAILIAIPWSRPLLRLG